MLVALLAAVQGCGSGANTVHTTSTATATTTMPTSTTATTRTTSTTSTTTPAGTTSSTSTTSTTTPATPTTPPTEAAQQLCDAGKAYLDAHLESEALASYEKALAADPTSPCAKQGVKSASPHVLAGLRKAVVGWLSNPLVVLAIAAFALLLLARIVLFFVPPLRGWLTPLPLVGVLVAPRLTVAAVQDEAADNKVGSPLGARIVERLQRSREEAFRAESHTYSLDFGLVDEAYFSIVAGNSALDNALAKAQDVSSQAKTVAALIGLFELLLPRPVLEVEGVLDPPTGPTAAVTFTLKDGSKLDAAAVLTARPAGDKIVAGDYLGIADTAAAWIQFEAGRGLNGQDCHPGAGESYALAHEGLQWHLKGDEPRARGAFLDAISLDSRNWAARVNLALTEARIAGAYDTSIAILEVTLREYEEDGAG